MTHWTPETVLRSILDDPYIEKLGSWRLRGERALARRIEVDRPRRETGLVRKDESRVTRPNEGGNNG